MRYCADTWFLLELAAKEPKAIRILQGVREGKDRLVIPLTVIAETSKKLLQHGISFRDVDTFFETLEFSDKVHILYPDRAVAREAARVSLSYAVPMFDAFVAASAQLAQCDTLLSHDSDFAPLVKRKYLKMHGW